jgi:hypothetical protein
MKAADDFRDMFPNFFDTDSSLSIRLRNEEKHLWFASLQLELMIPTRAQGRRSFYYGKILGDIKDILKSRERLVIAPNDHRKLRDYIQFLGEDHSDVRQFRIAEDNTKHITKDTQHFRDSFRTQFLALLESNCRPTMDSPILVHAYSGTRSKRQSSMQFVVRSSQNHLHGLPLLSILAYNHSILLGGTCSLCQILHAKTKQQYQWWWATRQQLVSLGFSLLFTVSSYQWILCIANFCSALHFLFLSL